MTTTTNAPLAAGQQIVLLAKVGSQRFTLTANQLRDTVAAYLARGEHMPTPTDINGGDPNAALHVIVEEWLWGNVTGWTQPHRRRAPGPLPPPRHAMDPQLLRPHLPHPGGLTCHDCACR